eukprot:scaffold7512_cov133-Skeletonema_marinoi.AAC.6
MLMRQLWFSNKKCPPSIILLWSIQVNVNVLLLSTSKLTHYPSSILVFVAMVLTSVTELGYHVNQQPLPQPKSAHCSWCVVHCSGYGQRHQAELRGFTYEHTSMLDT